MGALLPSLPRLGGGYEDFLTPIRYPAGREDGRHEVFLKVVGESRNRMNIGEVHCDFVDKRRPEFL